MSFSNRLSLISLFSAALLALLVAWRLGWYAWQAWLLAVNLVTLLLYAYDKASSRRSGMRVPEKTLLLLGFLGGSPAAFLSMQMLRHKISKPSFLRNFWLLAAAQTLLLFAWVFFSKRFL